MDIFGNCKKGYFALKPVQSVAACDRNLHQGFAHLDRLSSLYFRGDIALTVPIVVIVIILTLHTLRTLHLQSLILLFLATFIALIDPLVVTLWFPILPVERGYLLL